MKKMDLDPENGNRVRKKIKRNNTFYYIKGNNTLHRLNYMLSVIIVEM